MEPNLERMRPTDSDKPSPSLDEFTPRQILAHSLKVFSDHLTTQVIPDGSFWIRYDVHTGAVLSVHGSETYEITSLSPGGGRHIRPSRHFLKEGVPIRYDVKNGIKPLNFYIPWDENHYTQNVKAFEMAIEILASSHDHPATLQDIITPVGIYKLLRAKPRTYPDRFCTPDPLLIFISRFE